MAITLNGTTGITTPGLSADSPTLTVDSANNRVGIGTTITSSVLHIYGGDNNNYADGIIMHKVGGNMYGIYPSTNNLEFRSVTGNTHIATFDYNGNVGIGTDNPGDKLSIHSAPNSLVLGAKDTTRGNHIFQLLADDAAGNGEIRLYQNSGSGTHTKTVEIASSGNSYFNGGNVGIGTNNPTTNLQVNAASDEATISLYNATTKKAALQTQNSFGTILYSYDSEPLIFSVASGTSYSEKARVTSTGNVQIANGNLVFSTSGTGIDFSATADGSGTTSSELFDDYEEGTWTPAVERTSQTGAATHTRQSGRYTKIGNVVTIWFDVLWSSAPNGSGDYVIAGLPYSAETGIGAAYGGYGAPQFRDASGLSSNIRIYGNSSYHETTYIYTQHYDSSGNPGASPFNAAGRITGWSQYFV